MVAWDTLGTQSLLEKLEAIFSLFEFLDFYICFYDEHQQAKCDVPMLHVAMIDHGIVHMLYFGNLVHHCQLWNTELLPSKRT